MTNGRQTLVPTIVGLAHLVVMLLHGQAHERLGVSLTPGQNAYVVIVIAITPLFAMLLLWTRYVRIGLVLFVLSMAGSLIFGVLYHYLVLSPDHIFYIPPGEAAGMFRLTALLLMLTELFGVVTGLIGLRSNRKVYS